MKITQIKRSEQNDIVVIEYINGNRGAIFSSMGFGAELSTPQLVKLFEDPSYDGNGFNCESYTKGTDRLSEGAEDWVVEYSTEG